MIYVGRYIKHLYPCLLCACLFSGVLLTGCRHTEAPTTAGYYAGPMKGKRGWDPDNAAGAKRSIYISATTPGH